MKDARVVAVVATYRRSAEIARLLASLKASAIPLHGIVITDNADDFPTGDTIEHTTLRHHLVRPGKNLGCGGGLRLAEEAALREFPELTHVWVLDDDVVLEPGTLGTLLAAMDSEQAGSACPMPHDAEGRLGWYPGLVRPGPRRVLTRSATPAEYLEKCGPAPEPFTWATGVALLVSRATLEKAGLHRDDFWMRGEDLDFALRLTQAARGVFVPTATVAHLPPGGGKVIYNFAERMKHAAMLQNCAYLITRTRHGRSIARHWPGNVWRHLKWFGLRALGDVVRAKLLGGLRGLPAGAPGGEYFRERLARGK
jgi:GT2 family glycosyltransferase